MKIVELILDEEQELAGIEAISVVESPAIEEDFVALKAEEIKLAEVNKEKRILMGALLIPNKPIYRRSGEDEYYIYFSKDTVLKASQKYLMAGNQNNSTMEHQYELKGLSLVESWIIEDEVHDKSRKYGMELPIGTWMGAVKVNNDDVWENYVKTLINTFNGSLFSTCLQTSKLQLFKVPPSNSTPSATKSFQVPLISSPLKISKGSTGAKMF